MNLGIKIENRQESQAAAYVRRFVLSAVQTPDADPAPPGVRMAMVIRELLNVCT